MKKNTAMPLISCLCLTRNRPKFLKRAIQCFISQTYINKELVVVYLKNDVATSEVLLTVDNICIRSVEVDSDLNLSTGELRNLSIEHSYGEYFCQWDDDDWNNCERLQIQMDGILYSNKEASILPRWFMYDEGKKEAYLSNYGPWAASVLCSKSIITDKLNYPKLNKMEDSRFLGKLLKINCLYPIQVPQLYIYVYHGNNTWDEEHFNKMFSRSKKMPENINELIEAIISGKVCDSEGSSLLNSPEVLREIDYFN